MFRNRSIFFNITGACVSAVAALDIVFERLGPGLMDVGSLNFISKMYYNHVVAPTCTTAYGGHAACLVFFAVEMLITICHPKTKNKLEMPIRRISYFSYTSGSISW